MRMVGLGGLGTSSPSSCLARHSVADEEADHLSAKNCLRETTRSDKVPIFNPPYLSSLLLHLHPHFFQAFRERLLFKNPHPCQLRRIRRSGSFEGSSSKSLAPLKEGQHLLPIIQGLLGRRIRQLFQLNNRMP